MVGSLPYREYIPSEMFLIQTSIPRTKKRFFLLSSGRSRKTLKETMTSPSRAGFLASIKGRASPFSPGAARELLTPSSSLPPTDTQVSLLSVGVVGFSLLPVIARSSPKMAFSLSSKGHFFPLRCHQGNLPVASSFLGNPVFPSVPVLSFQRVAGKGMFVPR